MHFDSLTSIKMGKIRYMNSISQANEWQKVKNYGTCFVNQKNVIRLNVLIDGIIYTMYVCRERGWKYKQIKSKSELKHDIIHHSKFNLKYFKTLCICIMFMNFQFIKIRKKC